MKRIIYIVLIITSCSNSNKTEIIINNKWFEKNSLKVAYFDSSHFYFDKIQYHYVFKKDILTLVDSIWEENDDMFELVEVKEINFKVKYINKDSLYLIDLRPIEDNDGDYSFYSKDILYDTTINLESIFYGMDFTPFYFKPKESFVIK